MKKKELESLRSASQEQDWQLALEISGTALAEISGSKRKKSMEWVYEALLLRAAAHEHCEQTEEARACYRLAVEERADCQEAYLKWITCEERLGHRLWSQRILKAGITNASENTELRMLQNEVIDRPTVSVCMIVKNEEKLLANCLSSVRDIADEIILVDTGSEDGTVAIAESFGCKVFHQEWEGHFSKHRNYSIEQATSDWILIIDADEELVADDLPALRAGLEQKTHSMLSVTVYNIGERSGKGMSFLPSIRLFKRELGLRYEGIVHNRLNYSSDTPELRCPVGIRHYGYDLEPEKMRKKHERSKALLLKQLDEEPDNAFAHFNLAQLIRAESNFSDDSSAEAVIRHARETIRLTDPEDKKNLSLYIMAHHQEATALYALRRLDEAESVALRVLKLKPDYFDAVITLGYIYMQCDRLDESEARFNEYLKLQEEFSEHSVTDGIIIVHFQSRHNAYYNLGLIAEMRDDMPRAARQYESAAAECEGYLDTLGRIGWAHLRCGKTAIAEEWFRKQRSSDPTVDNSYTGIANILNDRGDTAGALNELNLGLDQVEDARALYGSLAEIKIGQGMYSEALITLEAGIEEYPEFGTLYSLRGDAQNLLDKSGEAADSYQTAERLSPGEPQIALGMANALLKNSDNLGAIRWFHVALERDPYSAQARRNLAISLIKLERHAEALEYLKSYVEIATEDSESRTILGALYLELGEGDAAIGVFEDLLRDNPSDHTALLALSDCHLALGSAASATLGYQRLLVVDPNHQIAKDRLEALKVTQGA